MKQILLRTCLAAGLASLALSCSLQEFDILDAFSPGDRFYARIESSDGPDTKVYADDKLRVLWDAEDHISIFNKYTYNQEYRFAGKTGDNSGAFKIVPNDDFVTGNELDLVYAVYPYQESTSIDNDGVLTVTLPATQAYRENSFGRGANTMVSCTANNQLLFKNIGGYLSLKLYGENVSVSSISIKGNKGEPLAGEAVVHATTGDAPTMDFQASSSGEITLVMEEPVTLAATAAEAGSFWFVLPPTVFSEGFTLTVTDPAGNTFEKATSKSFSISRNTLSRMSALNVTMSGATDLSENGTANSYIVPSAGIYKFKADVKGNSTLALDGTASSAEVLWESFGTETAPEKGGIVRNVRFKDGYVFFETPGNQGNALIAVKDASGTILWSWHIWATPYNPDAEYDVYSTSGAEMMNRNLGALSNTPGDALANGLLYQWGRKDPFLGSSSTSQSTTSAAVPDGIANQMVSKTGETGNVDYVTKHPTNFINEYNLDWMSTPDYTLWASDKTQYDPCPPGWKVPSASVYTGWQSASYDYTNHGVLFGTAYSNPATWYPFSGQIFGELTDVGDRFDHWTSTNDGASAVSPHAGSDYFNLTSYYDMSGIGQSVRCVRESYQEVLLESSLAEIADRADGTTVKTGPVQVMAKTTLGVIISDPTGQMFVYSKTDLPASVGDMIQLTAAKTTYRNLPELHEIQSLEVLSTGNPVSYPAPEDITSRTDFNDPFFSQFQYVMFEGSLRSWQTGNHGVSYLIQHTENESLPDFYLFYPFDYQNTEGYSLGDHVQATGYFSGFNGNINNLCIIITSMTVEPRHPVAVDMGLSVMWSSCCLGATKPEEYNKDYAWGATVAYQDGGAYPWGEDDSSQPLKYNNTDRLSVLLPEDDAATVILGDLWRMPTVSEVRELENPDNCTWTQATVNGIRGFNVVSKLTGNQIFMPLGQDVDYAVMWTSNIGMPENHSYVMNYSYEDGGAGITWGWRSVAHGVRPVYGEWIHLQGIDVDQKKVEMAGGEKKSLSVTYSPATAFEKNLFWSSSDERVATVSDKGVVTAVGTGSAIITATSVDGGYTSSCTVTVKWSIPLNQIWYTSSDGEIIEPVSGTVFYNAAGKELTYTNTWVDNKWVMEFSDDVAYWRGNWFHNYPGSVTNRVATLGLPASIQGGKFAGTDQDQLFYAAGLNANIQEFYGDYQGIADNGHLLLIGEDYSRVLGCANAFTGTITVPEGVTDIHHYGFHYSQMSTLILPSTIQKLGYFCLEDCQQLTNIYCYALECPEADDSIWTYVHSSGTLHYPVGSDYSLFPLPSGWRKVADINEWDGFRLKATSDNTVLVLTHSSLDKYPGRDLYYSCNTLDWVKWEYNAEVTLKLNQNLYLKGNVIFGDTCRIEAKSGTAYGSGYICSLFDNGTDYTSTTIPAQALQDVFVKDGGITGELRFPDVVKEIGTRDLFCYTCYGSWWTSVILPSKLELIGRTCFEGNRMTEITIPKTVKYIGDAAFNGCHLLSTVYFTGTVAEWEAIEKGDYRWEDGPPATTVTCTDGEAAF